MEKKTNKTLEELAVDLYQKRKLAAESKSFFRNLSVEIGACKFEIKCPYSGLQLQQWCQVCQTKQPAWEEYKGKANAAGAALRGLLTAAKKRL